MSDPFEKLDAKDGFHVVQLDVGANISLHCQAYGGGELYNIVSTNPDDATIEIKEWPVPTPVDYGACNRLRLVLDSVARYLTTGGQWNELEDSIQRMRRIASGGIVFDGWHLSDSYSTTDGTYQHLFVNNDGSGAAVLWEEPTYSEAGGVIGGFIDYTDLETINRKNDEEADEWEEAPEEAATNFATPETHQLSDKSNPNGKE